jgi:hypothetical protein
LPVFTLWTIGYGRWPVASRARRLIDALSDAGITRVADVRLNPCASDPVPGRPYGPKPWNLQAGDDAGLVALLREGRIGYEWLVELGNPQRQDPAMRVLLAQLADPAGGWPVHRGLLRLSELVREPNARVAILCACGTPSTCHRTLVAQALRDRHFGGALTIQHL